MITSRVLGALVNRIGESSDSATGKPPSRSFSIPVFETKAFTSTAVLALVEEGKIGLNEPVGHFIPTFTKTSVAVKSDTGVNIVPARRAITIQDLLTHTAGISYGTDKHVASLYEPKGLGPAAGNGWYTALGAPR